MPFSLSDFDDALAAYTRPLIFDEVCDQTGVTTPLPVRMFAGLDWEPAELHDLDSRWVHEAFLYQAPVRVAWDTDKLFPVLTRLATWIDAGRTWGEDLRDWWRDRPRVRSRR